MAPRASFELALRLRSGQATLAEVFSFMSGLYFRGKVAYARRFTQPVLPGRQNDFTPECQNESRGTLRQPSGIWAIVPGRGLIDIDQIVTLAQVRAMARVPVHLDEPRYVRPLERAARSLARRLTPDTQVVLLGSIATSKYTRILSAAFDARLSYPHEFQGIGDMSRGALMLRRAASGEELTYRPVPVNVTRVTRSRRSP